MDSLFPNPPDGFTRNQLADFTLRREAELVEAQAQPAPRYPVPLAIHVEHAISAAEWRKNLDLPAPPPPPSATLGVLTAYRSGRLPLPAGPNEAGVWEWSKSYNCYRSILAHAMDIGYRSHGDPWDRRLIAQTVRENRLINVTLEWRIPIDLFVRLSPRELLNRTLPVLCDTLHIPEHLVTWQWYRVMCEGADGQDLARNGMSVEVWLPDEEYGV